MQDIDRALRRATGRSGVRTRFARAAILGGAAAAGMLLVSTVLAQQPQNLGVAPVTLRDDPYTFDTAEQHGIRVSIAVRGLAHPFSLAFLPNGDALVSERSGPLRLVHGVATASQDDKLDPRPIAGTPEPPGIRNFGLHEVALHPRFAENRWVYFTYNKVGELIPNSNPPGRRQAAVALGRGKLEGQALTGVEELFTGEWFNSASGSRLAFGRDGLLYMTTGAPFGESAQDVASVYGKVLRLQDDGKPARDNPFVGKAGARPEIFTLGHRDQLGLVVDPASGSVLAAEHGPNGGDEINLILPGRNYGWPKWSFGRNYEGPRWSPAPLGEGIEQPQILWLPSIAPTGLAFYTGDKIPAWKGNLFVGSARIGEIPRTGGLERVVLNDKLEELRRERLLGDLHQRIRDVRPGPDGLLYALTDEDDGALLRIEPAAL
jgi:glucose/arabinose dehydrogenase